MTAYHSSYVADLSSHRPALDELRIEDEGKPTVADLIPIGSIIETSYNSGPYFVDSVKSYECYGLRVWTLSGFSADEAGNYTPNENRRFWINECVADHTGSAPVIRKLFRANEDVVTIIGTAHAVDRRGQGLLL